MSKVDEPWSEPPANSSPELFDTQAAGFDERAGLPANVCREIARKVIELGEVAPEDLLLEIGAGTGQIGQWLGSRARYIGLDLSAGMLLEFARRSTGSAATGALIQADANMAWPVADGMTRAIFGSRVLHLLNPQRVAERVRPGRLGAEIHGLARAEECAPGHCCLPRRGAEPDRRR